MSHSFIQLVLFLGKFLMVLLSVMGEPTAAPIDLRDVPLIGKISLDGENSIFMTGKGVKIYQNS